MHGWHRSAEIAESASTAQYQDTMRTPPPVLPPDADGASYKRSFMDRHGPDGGITLRAYAYGLMVGLLATAGAARIVGFGFTALVVGAAVGALAARLALRFVGAAGSVATAFTLTTGSSTPYVDEHSQLEALVARADIASALSGYEAVLLDNPGDQPARLRLADLYAAGARDPERAAMHFRAVRDFPGASARDAVYASSRLADLYDGPLDTPGRALVELRRMVERYPASPMSQHARAAIPRLKARMGLVEEAD